MRRWEKRFWKWSRTSRLSRRRSSGPDEKVLELGAALGAAFFGIVNYVLPQGFENGHKGGAPGPCDLRIHFFVKEFEQFFQALAAVLTRHGIRIPVRCLPEPHFRG